MSKNTAVLVACGKDKRDKRSPVWKLYTSTLFEKGMTAAMTLGVPFVMSAKHHLVRPTERLDPYDEYLGDKSEEEKREWGREVVDDIPNHFNEVVLLGGEDYRCPVIEAIEDCDIEIKNPYEHTSGNGQQMGWCGDASGAVLNNEEVNYDGT